MVVLLIINPYSKLPVYDNTKMNLTNCKYNIEIPIPVPMCPIAPPLMPPPKPPPGEENARRFRLRPNYNIPSANTKANYTEEQA